MKDKMNLEPSKTRILVSGLYYSGSSAVADLLKEFDNIGIYPEEFNHFRGTGLVGDSLDNSQIQKTNKIESFLSSKGGEDYQIVGSYSNSGRIRKNLHRLLDSAIDLVAMKATVMDDKHKRALSALECLQRQLSTESSEENIKYAIAWLKKIDAIYAEGMDYVVYDQAIYMSKHLQLWPVIFNPFKLIVVIRNPLDQLAQLIESNKVSNDHNKCTTNGIGDIFGNGIDGQLNYQATALLARYNQLEKLLKHLSKKSILIVDFEDVVLNYETTKNSIINFITNSKNDVYHARAKRHLKPELSRKNIDLSKNYRLVSAEQQVVNNCVNSYNLFRKVSQKMLGEFN